MEVARQTIKEVAIIFKVLGITRIDYNLVKLLLATNLTNSDTFDTWLDQPVRIRLMATLKLFTSITLVG